MGMSLGDKPAKRWRTMIDAFTDQDWSRPQRQPPTFDAKVFAVVYIAVMVVMLAGVVGITLLWLIRLWGAL